MQQRIGFWLLIVFSLISTGFAQNISLETQVKTSAPTNAVYYQCTGRVCSFASFSFNSGTNQLSVGSVSLANSPLWTGSAPGSPPSPPGAGLSAIGLQTTGVWIVMTLNGSSFTIFNGLQGSQALTGGTATVTFSGGGFASTPLCSCNNPNQSGSPISCSANPTTTTVALKSGAGTDTVSWFCHANIN